MFSLALEIRRNNLSLMPQCTLDLFHEVEGDCL